MQAYQDIFDHHQDAVAVFDHKHFVYLNPAFYALFIDQPAEELIDRLPEDLLFNLQPVFSEQSLSWEMILKRVVEQKHSREHIYCHHLNHLPVLTEWTFTLQKAKPQQVYLLIIKKLDVEPADTSDNLQVKDPKLSYQRLHKEYYSLSMDCKALAKSRDFYRKMVRNSPDLLMRFDRELRYIYLSDNAEQASGVPVREFIGKKVSDASVNVPENIIRLWTESLEEVRDQKHSKRIEFMFPNGTWLDWYLMPELDEKGEVITIFGYSRNITKIKEIETQLTLSQSKLRTLTEASPDIVMEYNHELNHTYCSRNVTDYIELSAEDFIGRKIWEVPYTFSEEFYEEWTNNLKSVLEKGETQRKELKLPNGHYWDWYVVPNWDSEHKEVLSAFSFSRDITALKAAQKKLVTFAEASPDVVMEFDRDLRHLFCSKNIGKHIGIPASEFIGKTYQEMAYDFDTELVRKWQETLRWVFEHQEEKRVEFKIQGQGYWDWYVVPNWDEAHEKVQSVVVYSRDITPIKEAQKKLDSLAEASPDVVMEFDRQVRVLYVNKNITNHSGLVAEEFIGKTHREVEYAYPERLIDFWEEKIRMVFEQGKSQREEFQHPDGTYWDWYVVPNWDDDGQTVLSVWTFSRDITKRRVAEEELLMNKEKLALAIETAQMAFWEVNLTTGRFQLNDSLADLYGIPITPGMKRQWKVKEFIRAYVLEEDRQRMLDKAIENEQDAISEKEDIGQFRIIKNGKIHHFISYGQVLQSPQNGLVYYGTSQDITDIKEREEELKLYRTQLEKLVVERTRELEASERKLQDAMEMAHLETWEYHPIEGCFYTSRKMFDMLGLPAEGEKRARISLKTYIEHIHPNDWPLIKEAFFRPNQVIDEHFEDHLEYRMIGEDGEIRTIFTSLKQQLNPEKTKVEKIYGVIQNISEMRRTETEKERLQVFAENTPDILLIADAHYKLTFLNKAGRRFFNIQLQQGDVFIDRDLPGQIISEEGLKTAMKTGTWTGEHQMQNLRGHLISVSQAILVMRNETGEVDSIMANIRDISRQKQIEQELRFKRQELDTFVYRASHDLRGPIASLQGLNQIVMHDLQDQPKALSIFKMYNKEIEKLHNILITLIDITRIKDRELQHAPIDFYLMIQNELDSLRTYPGYEQLRFCKRIALPKSYYGDKALVSTVMHSLLQNTIDYRADNKEPRVLIKVGFDRTLNQLIIEVKDNGQGIEPQIQTKVFDMFYRGSENSEGPGLGLYMVKNIIDRLNGKVWINSQKDRGTSVVVSLPFVEGGE